MRPTGGGRAHHATAQEAAPRAEQEILHTGSLSRHSGLGWPNPARTHPSYKTTRCARAVRLIAARVVEELDHGRDERHGYQADDHERVRRLFVLGLHRTLEVGLVVVVVLLLHRRTLFKKLLLRWAQLVVVTRKHGGAILLHHRRGGDGRRDKVGVGGAERQRQASSNSARRGALAEPHLGRAGLGGRAHSGARQHRRLEGRGAGAQRGERDDPQSHSC
mmetsp:Transcript_44189/g.116807  ORF Transcript_44189/g.116807 Transcript_44189/m.116807 type:complete len:219 (-) Transcript_44189:35-691(-)